jgi:chromosome segregation ATPase
MAMRLEASLEMYSATDFDQARIEQYQTHVSELEDQNRELQEGNNSLTEQLDKLRKDNEAQAGEAATLRSRSNLSQQNWIKERDELISREAFAREEFENAKQAMQDWEVLAMNERSIRENLSDKEAELKEQIESLREAYEKAARDRDTNNEAVEGLQKALQEVQNRTSIRTVLSRRTNKMSQYARPSCGDRWRTMNRRSMSSGNRCRWHRKLPPRLRRRSRRPRKSSRGPYLSKKK